jgi:hypothetical protein
MSAMTEKMSEAGATVPVDEGVWSPEERGAFSLPEVRHGNSGDGAAKTAHPCTRDDRFVDNLCRPCGLRGLRLGCAAVKGRGIRW